eukprot:CAMPEP_0172459352 /NCGR_PEP_ID=MMETSP1065-20121228/32263_1 /TAXON_ID=265537 /ORGANISM="Amphiprora paludosa, Strain CCMP125" /LENGTH=654 /DNA_ID=CAMNT_0013214009 /DNA_START=248 /DNA_END=2212 /DNA_ORIENTATION=+
MVSIVSIQLSHGGHHDGLTRTALVASGYPQQPNKEGSEVARAVSNNNGNRKKKVKMSDAEIKQLKKEHKDTAAICVVQKDETQYMNEWVDYHLALGFSDIYIYDNSVSHEPLSRWDKTRKLRNSDEQNRVHLIHHPGEKVQIPVYKKCASLVKEQQHTWVTFLDVDEFFVLKKHDNVVDFAKEYAKRGHVGINWQIFGTSGRLTYEKFPVTQRFQCVHPIAKQMYIKSFMKVNDISPIRDIHSPHTFPRRNGTDLVDTNGALIDSSRHKGPRDVALIYHYIYRSHEEHIQKRSRGDVFFGNREDRANWTEQAENGIDPWSGKPLPAGSIVDDSAWQTMKKLIPAYGEKYESKKQREDMKCSMHHTLKDKVKPKTEDSVALCAIAKDDSWYMNEWADYHLGLGFSDLYIYDHSSSQKTMVKWMQRRKDPRLHVIPFPGDDIRVSAYKDCARLMKQMNHTWVLYADVNQYLVLKNHDNVIDFANKHVQKGQVGLNWKVFGTSGRTKYEPWPVTQRFTCRLSYFFVGSMKFSSFIRVSDMGAINALTSPSMFPRKQGTFLLDTNRRRIMVQDRHNGPRDVAVIHHYLTRSEDEHKQRIEKNGADNSTFSFPLNELPAGSIHDSEAWETLKRVSPTYSRFEQRNPKEEAECSYSPDGY